MSKKYKSKIERIPNRGVQINQKKFGNRIKQLSHIILDEDYVRDSTSESYFRFVTSMYDALVNGRKITPKMDKSIYRIVLGYKRYLDEKNNPEFKQTREKYIETTLSKTMMIRDLLSKCSYTRGYEAGSLHFLESIDRQVKNRASLSMKQRQALNKMYKQFLKKSEKKTWLVLVFIRIFLYEKQRKYEKLKKLYYH